jgi:hypothetical protein
MMVCAIGVSFPGRASDGRGSKAVLKQDRVSPVYADGPSIADQGFEAWLKAQVGPVKLPFTIWRKPHRVGAIGVHQTKPASVVSFSDAALGIPLDERLKQLCGDAEPCRVWLAGWPGKSMPMPDPNPAKIFDVHAVDKRVEGEGPHAAQVVRGNACLAIRSLKPLHCARGPNRCDMCKRAQAEPAVPRLLDLCPHGEVTRLTIEVVRDGKTIFAPYDVLQTFADAEAARMFAKTHGLMDVSID